jgi:hypothetical protein
MHRGAAYRYTHHCVRPTTWLIHVITSAESFCVPEHSTKIKYNGHMIGISPSP